MNPLFLPTYKFVGINPIRFYQTPYLTGIRVLFYFRPTILLWRSCRRKLKRPTSVPYTTRKRLSTQPQFHL